MGPPEDPRADGIRRFRVSNALHWSAAARRLMAEPSFVAKLLSVVAAYVCIDLCLRLVKGTRHVRGEAAAAADCPLSLAVVALNEGM